MQNLRAASPRPPGTVNGDGLESREAPMQDVQLPFVDEHATDIAADTDAVWSALVDSMAELFSGAAAGWFTRAIGCTDRAASGPRPLDVGSTIPAFRVEEAVPGSMLVLCGSHRFSDYALTFRLEGGGPDRTRLTAETRAAFPGVLGGVYRVLVIGTRGHVVAVRRMLADVRRRAEREAHPASPR